MSRESDNVSPKGGECISNLLGNDKGSPIYLKQGVQNVQILNGSSRPDKCYKTTVTITSDAS